MTEARSTTSAAPIGEHEHAFRTWELVLMVAVASTVFAYASMQTLSSPGVFAVLAGDRLSPEQAATQHSLVLRFRWWSVAVAAVLSLFRIGVVALTLQLPLLLMLADVPLRALLRLATIAFLPLLGGTALQLIPLGQVADGLRSAESLARPWGSLAALSSLPGGAGTTVLAQLNVFELSWLVIVAVGLRRLLGGSWLSAVVVSAGTWLVLTSLMLGILLLMQPAP